MQFQGVFLRKLLDLLFKVTIFDSESIYFVISCQRTTITAAGNCIICSQWLDLLLIYCLIAIYLKVGHIATIYHITTTFSVHLSWSFNGRGMIYYKGILSNWEESAHFYYSKCYESGFLIYEVDSQCFWNFTVL